MLGGFALPNAVTLGWLAATGALPFYWEQVWQWGLAYAASSPKESAMAPLLRLGSWAGFHAALLLGAARMRGPRKQLAMWIAISFVAVVIGWRMPPRYFNILLPPLVIAAAGGWALWSKSRVWVAVAVVLLAIPLIRFGPRYVQLAADNVAGREHDWADVKLDQESRAAAKLIDKIRQPGDTIFIWGYRPNVIAYTRLPVRSRFWDSQPLTGVPADRHLSESLPMEGLVLQSRRERLARTTPTFLVDGLSNYNPALDMQHYNVLRSWLYNYCRVGEAGGIVIYRRCR
jgi:hypothetical protein